jgi:hypothetical protein
MDAQRITPGMAADFVEKGEPNTIPRANVAVFGTVWWKDRTSISMCRMDIKACCIDWNVALPDDPTVKVNLH